VAVPSAPAHSPGLHNHRTTREACNADKGYAGGNQRKLGTPCSFLSCCVSPGLRCNCTKALIDVVFFWAPAKQKVTQLAELKCISARALHSKDRKEDTDHKHSCAKVLIDA